MSHPYRIRSNSRGFSLVEALVALLVLSFGMLAIAGFQVTLTRSSDLAKQRTEATRLAQQKMESLRAYAQVATSPPGLLHVVNYTDDVVSGPPVASPDVTTTNATFTRTWTVTANPVDTEKWINVLVTWNDRAGQAQTVQLLSVISKFDPKAIGTLATGRGAASIRKPKNRNVSLPYPVATLSGGIQSVFIPPPGNIAYVFDNNTGNIVKSCTGLTQANLVEGLDLAAAVAAAVGTCTDIAAYLLSGHVRFDTDPNPSGKEPTSPSDSRYFTLPLAVSTPLSIDTSNVPTSSVGGTPPTMVCYAERQKVVSTTNTAPVTITSVTRSSGSTVTVNASGHAFVDGQKVAINVPSNPAYNGNFTIFDAAVTPGSFKYTSLLPAGTPAGSNGTAALLERLTIADGSFVAGYAVVSRFVAYACVITPVDHDNVPGTDKRWWGRVTLNPDGWVIGGQYQVCRYSADFNGNAAISNREHPLWYRGVTRALDGQNYLVINASQSCPTDKAANPLGSSATYADNTTARHQPSSGEERSFQCADAACSGGSKVVLEPPVTSTDLAMD